MLKTRRKPHSGKRIRPSDVRHWLDEGVAGQESLRLELDPFLYAADAAVYRIASSVAHRNRDKNARPVALFVPACGGIGWQLGFLSQHYDVVLICDDADAITVAAAEHFNVELCNGAVPSHFESVGSFYLMTKLRWGSSSELIDELRDAESWLHPGGVVAAVFLAKEEGEGPEICWADGSSVPVKQFANGEVFRLPKPSAVQSVALPSVNPCDGALVSKFLKRNRAYFGRGVRELFLERASDPDFSEPFGYDGSINWAVTATWTMGA